MNLTDKFSLDKIAAIKNAPLKDINNTVLLEESLQKDISEQLDKFQFAVDGEAGIKISLFNDADDDNDNEVAEELKIESHVGNGSAFLCYEIGGKLKGGLKGELDNVALGLNVSGEVSHQSFLIHKKSALLHESILKNIADFKYAINLKSLKNLENNEAVVLYSKGAIDFDATVSVSDTFTPMLSKISKLIGATGTISLKIDMSASINVNLSIADEFQTIIQRRDNAGKPVYYVSINKEFKSKRQITGKLGASAAISNPDVVEETINQIIERGEKGLSKAVEKLKDKAISQFSATDKEKLKRAAELIGLDPEDPLKSLRDKYFEKKKDLVEKIMKVIKEALALSVSYTYEKNKEKKSVLKASISEPLFEKHFDKVIRLQVKDLYALKDTAGFDVKAYLDLSKTEIVQAMKIGFNVSDFELSQLVKKTVEFEDQLMYDGKEAQRVSFTSTKFTSEKLGVFKERQNSMTLSGVYSGDVKPEIHMTNLDYEFSLSWSENYNRLNEAKIKKAVDFAVTWGILDEKDFKDKYDELSKLLKGKRKTKFSAYMKMKEGLFDNIVDDILSLSEHRRCEILAASVPFADFSGRLTPTERRGLYYSFFVTYSKQQTPGAIDYDKVKKLIAGHLRDNGRIDLADFEATGEQQGDYTPINRLLEHNFNMIFKFDNFKNAMESLQNNDKPFQSIVKSKSFLRNQNFIRLQPEYNMRFMGRLILELSEGDGIADEVERTMTIEFKNDKDEDEKLVLAR